MKKHTIWIVLLILFAFSYQEKYHNPHVEKLTNLTLQNICDSMATFELVEEAYIGIGAAPSEKYAYFMKLLEIASDDELLELTKNENPVIAAYAAKGVLFRSKDKMFELYEYFLENDKRIRYSSGCMILGMNLSEYIEGEIRNQLQLYEEEGKEFTKEQLGYIQTLNNLKVTYKKSDH